MCELTLCLWALGRWWRERWPESGVLGLNLCDQDLPTIPDVCTEGFSFPKTSSTLKSPWTTLWPALPAWILGGGDHREEKGARCREGDCIQSLEGLCFPSLCSTLPNKKLFIASFRHLLVSILTVSLRRFSLPVTNISISKAYKIKKEHSSNLDVLVLNILVGTC